MRRLQSHDLVRLWSRRIVIGLFALLLPLPAAARDAELAKNFAYAAAASATAAHHCGDMVQDGDRLLTLQKAAGLSQSDSAWLAAQFLASDTQIKVMIAEQGLPKWCASTWKRLGPAPGLGVLRRQAEP